MSIRNIRLNLLPPEYRPAPTVTIFPIFFGVLVGLGVLFISIMFMVTQAKVNVISAKVEITKSEIESLKPFVDSYDGIMRSIKELRVRKAMFVFLDNNFIDWHLFIANITPLVPEDVWLFELIANSHPDIMNTGNVSIRGRTATGKVLPVSFFMENLEVSPYFSGVIFVDSILQFVAEKPVQEFTVEIDVESPRKFVREWKEEAPDEKDSGGEAAEKDSETNDVANVAAATPGIV